MKPTPVARHTRPSDGTSNLGRRGAVFSIRLTADERDLIQRAADLDGNPWFARSAAIGPWMKKAALGLAYGKLYAGRKGAKLPAGRERGTTTHQLAAGR